jgi:hypothetical protein
MAQDDNSSFANDRIRFEVSTDGGNTWSFVAGAPTCSRYNAAASTMFWQDYTANSTNFLQTCKQRITRMMPRPLLGLYEPQWVAFNWATMLHGLNCYNGTKRIDQSILNIYKSWNNSIVSQGIDYNTFISNLHQ